MTVNTEIQDYSEEFKNFINSCVKKENKEDVSKNLHEFFRSYYEQSANLDSIYKKIKNFSRIIFVLHPIPPKEEIREGTKIADAANGLGYTDKVLRDINDYNGKKEEFDDKFCLPFFYESIDILKIDKNFVDQACESHSIAIIDLAPFVIGKDDKGIDKFDMYIDMIDWPEAVQFAMDRFMQRLSKNYVNNLSLGVQCAFLTPAVVFNRIITFYEKKTLEYTLKANNVNEETGYLFFAELNDCDPETIKSIAYPKYKSFIDSNWKHEVQKEMLLNALGIGKAGKKHLEKYRNWALQKIVEAANHLDINSAIQQTNLRLLIRWYPQIDQNGEDSYSAY